MKFDKVYCQYPVDSKTSTDINCCGKDVNCCLKLTSNVKINLCKEHRDLVDGDGVQLDHLIFQIHDWLLSNKMFILEQ